MGLSSVERRNSRDHEYAALCMQARYADLLVIGQAMPADGEDTLLRDLPEHVILHAPVLVVPYAGSFPTLGERPLLACDGSLEAAPPAAPAGATQRAGL